MEREQTERVLIAGGGIAGLALRRALQRRGIPSLTWERRAEPADAGLAINLPGNAVQALAQLGLAQELGTLGAPIRRREYRTETGRLLFAIDEDAFWGDDRVPRCLRRADLLRLLALGLPSDDLRRDRGIAAFHQEAGGVAVTLTDGGVEAGGLLVGADGVHSTIRRGLFGDRGLAASAKVRASNPLRHPQPIVSRRIESHRVGRIEATQEVHHVVERHDQVTRHLVVGKIPAATLQHQLEDALP